MSKPKNRALAADRGLTTHVLLSCLDDEDAREATVLFVYEPDINPGLRLVLRAKPILRPLPSGSGHELGFEYELTGTDKSSANSHGGVGLGTDIPIEHRFVERALASQTSPIVEILLGQTEVAREFCQGSPAMEALVERWIYERSTPVPRVAGDARRDDGRL